MNHRALIGQYVALQNPHLRQVERANLRLGLWIGFLCGLGASAAIWFVCNIVVVG